MIIEKIRVDRDVCFDPSTFNEATIFQYQRGARTFGHQPQRYPGSVDIFFIGQDVLRELNNEIFRGELVLFTFEV